MGVSLPLSDTSEVTDDNGLYNASTEDNVRTEVESKCIIKAEHPSCQAEGTQHVSDLAMHTSRRVAMEKQSPPHARPDYR